MTRVRPGMISLLVPFRADVPARETLWKWLEMYWGDELPSAEIVIGHNKEKPFCKTAAVNDAAKHAHGDIFVILDADTYIDGDVIEHCARRIRHSEREGHPLWFVPYRHIYRLTEAATNRVLASSPSHPLRFPTPPHPIDVESMLGSGFGHRFGALIQIMSRRAFETVGGMDQRFKGWGGEDIAFLRALDTLYGPHKTTENDVLHLWHPKIGIDFRTRRWVGQPLAQANDKLAHRYHQATGNRPAMRELVDEGIAYGKHHWWFFR